MIPNVKSISSNSSNVRQDVFPLGQWTITTRKGIIMQSRCTCPKKDQDSTGQTEDLDELCKLCKYHQLLPDLPNMPDMLFSDNILRLEHFTGAGVEFNALDALRLVEPTKDPLRVAVADGWQNARADFPFAKSIVKPFDWTFTSDYRGTLLEPDENARRAPRIPTRMNPTKSNQTDIDAESGKRLPPSSTNANPSTLKVESTDERIDVNKLRVREEILFYDDVTLYEDELADHGTAQYSVKVRVMPKCLFMLARFYLRVDGVLARINDTRIYHELNKRYLLREYTNREARLSGLNLPVSTLVNPNELTNHLPLISSSFERLSLPER